MENNTMPHQEAMDIIKKICAELEHKQKVRALKELKKKDRKQFWLGVLSAVISSGIIALLGWVISLIF